MSEGRISRYLPLGAAILFSMLLLDSCMMIHGPRGGFGGRGRRGGPGPEGGDIRERVEDSMLRAERRFDMLCDSLDLDSRQKKEARQAFADLQDGRRQVFRGLLSGNLDLDEVGGKISGLYQVYYEKIAELLSAGQKEMLLRLRASGQFGPAG